MNDTPTAAPTTQPTTPDQLLARLAELGLTTRTVTHPPVFTVEEAKALRGELPGAHIKNLFLRDKKGKMWLVVAEEDRPIDLKALGELLGGRLSFGSADRLMTYLGVIPGAVTPFGVINDAGNQVQAGDRQGPAGPGPDQLPPALQRPHHRHLAPGPPGLLRRLRPPARAGGSQQGGPQGRAGRRVIPAGPRLAPGRPEAHLTPYLFPLTPAGVISPPNPPKLR